MTVDLNGARCAELDPAELARIYFPVKRRVGAADEAEARALCAQCPVKQPCLEAALDLGAAADGIWAATNAAERAQIRRQARRYR